MKQVPGFHYDPRLKRAVLDGYVPGTKGKIRRQKTLENVTRAKALDEWKIFRSDLESGRAIEGPLTLRQFVDQYYDLISAGHQESTRHTQRTLIDAHLLRYFDDSFLETITTVRVLDFMTDMRKRELSPSYINDAVRVLKMLLRQAVERDVIADYPIKKKVPKEKEPPLRLELKPEERTRFYSTFDDEEGFLRYLGDRRQLGPVSESEHFSAARRFGGGLRSDSKAAGAYYDRFRDLREFFIVAIETGLRNRSDLRNLKWTSVDFHGGFIRVFMQKTQLEAEIPMSAACRAALVARRAKSASGAYVFVDGKGKRFSLTRIRRVFVLAKKLAGITRRFRPHDLRHTFGCRLADRNIGLQKIAKALGHTTTRMAERYARPSEDAMREITKALDADPVIPSAAQSVGRPALATLASV